MQRISSSVVLTAVGLSLTVGCSETGNTVTTKTTTIIPEDVRPPVANPSTPPIFGGTMAALSAGRVAATDPARDTISIAHPTEGVQTLQLGAGSLPFRAIETPDGRLHVSLRGSGEVLVMDAATATEVERVDACSAPRGLAYDATRGAVHLACAEGMLLTYDASSYEKLTERQLDSDLRDVVVQGDRLYVSRFRAAEVIILEGGDVLHRSQPPSGTLFEFFGEDDAPRVIPRVAWRMIPRSAGGVYLLHQRATVDPIPLSAPGERRINADGNTEVVHISQEASSGSPYGGSAAPGAGPGCGAIVQHAVTAYLPDGTKASSGSLSGAVLPVDFAETQTGDLLLAMAGGADPDAPTTEVVVKHNSDGSGGVFSAALPAPVPSFGPGNTDSLGLLLTETLSAPSAAQEISIQCSGLNPVGLDSAQPMTAVVLNDEGRLVTQERQTAVLNFGRSLTSQSSNPFDLFDSANPLRVTLSNQPVLDTGHEVFHRDGGAGISCASCHPEGTTDGHVWNFEELGPRRTQNLALPLAETAPFHWDGSLPDLKTLMNEVFVGRMGGVEQSAPRLQALESWMFSRKAERLRGVAPDAVARGQQLFESEEVGCVRCHSGAARTDNLSHDVGTGPKLQTPPLVGLAFQGPFMHNGCALTLADRFDRECGGGDQHGKTSHLSAAELSDLVDYMKSL